MSHRPLVLTILDGWGYREDTEHNAIAQANTPNWDRWWQEYPHTLITGCGEAVGLPHGQMGNSEVGHMHLGAGRVVYQDLTRIGLAIKDGEFEQNIVLVTAAERAAANIHGLHLVGLISPGGVHSHEDHFLAMIELAAKHGAKKIYVHAFLDGRDTPPRSAKQSLQKIQAKLDELQCGKIVSIVGRYYGMDRDKRWDRTQTAYDLLTQAKAERVAADPISAIDLAYAADENDEFVKPTAIYTGNPITINDNDIVMFMNFRADRMRQICQAFSDNEFQEFNREKKVNLADVVTLTQYKADMLAAVAFLPQHIQNSFGEYIAEHSLKQLRIAETEKYAHVTFFFNGGMEEHFNHEDRQLIPSPKVATYDLQPEMSANELTNKLVDAINSKQYDVIICNYANADMVGHSGDFAATIKAVECIDTCLGKVAAALNEIDGEMIITADHGNAERMYNKETQQIHTAHTHQPVPVLYLGRDATITKSDGSLIDIAPTMLYLLGLQTPADMTGTSLIDLK